MSATGPNSPPADEGNLLTEETASITIGGSDVLMSTLFQCGEARVLVPQAAGNLAVKRKGDSGFTTYAVLASIPIYGKFVAVGGTGSGSTSALVVICEV